MQSKRNKHWQQAVLIAKLVCVCLSSAMQDIGCNLSGPVAAAVPVLVFVQGSPGALPGWDILLYNSLLWWPMQMWPLYQQIRVFSSTLHCFHRKSAASSARRATTSSAFVKRQAFEYTFFVALVFVSQAPVFNNFVFFLANRVAPK